MKYGKAAKLGGLRAIAFFTIKGLVWLGIIAWGIWFAT